jgi:hypothetical protein
MVKSISAARRFDPRRTTRLTEDCDSTIVFEPVEEALDQVPVAIQEGERRRAVPVRHRLNVRSGAMDRHENVLEIVLQCTL